MGHIWSLGGDCYQTHRKHEVRGKQSQNVSVAEHFSVGLLGHSESCHLYSVL